MKPFTTHAGTAAPLLVDNIDTDQIIPSREMKHVSKLGLGAGLFAGWRYQYDGNKRGAEEPGFVLNQAQFRDASILLAGKNFGCGSSREHAVWALTDYGIRCILAESFGRIFRSNCARNGLLAIALPAEAIADIVDAGTELQVDLEKQVILLANGRQLAFAIDRGEREMLLLGLDHIDYTLRNRDDIDRFVAANRQHRAWAHLD